jgi:hypothetical protein
MGPQEDKGHVHGLTNDDADDDRENASYDSLHDLDAGRYQDLLGHANVETTRIAVQSRGILIVDDSDGRG